MCSAARPSVVQNSVQVLLLTQIPVSATLIIHKHGIIQYLKVYRGIMRFYSFRTHGAQTSAKCRTDPCIDHLDQRRPVSVQYPPHGDASTSLNNSGFTSLKLNAALLTLPGRPLGRLRADYNGSIKSGDLTVCLIYSQ